MRTGRRFSKALVVAPVISAALLAFAVRSLPMQHVFGPEGEVYLAIADSSYHARRAQFTFFNFPEILHRDPYLAYPDGAVVPMPPLYDWTVGAIARGFGDTQATFERVAAWVAPTLSAITVVPVYAAGWMLSGHGAGIAAATIFALLPAHAESSRVGDVDSHAAVSLLGALYFALSLALAGPRPSRLWCAAAALAAVRAALALSWSGSLLYLGLGEGALLLAALVAGRTDLLRAQAVGALAAALLVAPWVASAPTPIGGSFTTTTLSWSHVAFLTGVSVLAGAISAVHVRRRLLVAGGIAVAGASLGFFAMPALIDSVAPGLSFLAKSDVWAAHNPEQAPLFSATEVAHREYGLLAYAIPLVFVVALGGLRDTRLRGRFVCLACWALVLGVLALSQVRFGSDFAPIASIGFACLLVGGARPLARRVPRPVAAAAAVVVGVTLLWPALAKVHAARVPGALLFLRHGTKPEQRLAGGPSLQRFFQRVRDSTPETSGFLDPASDPEYGVLCWPPHGHPLSYSARRAAPASGFGPYLDAEKLDATLRFYAAPSEARALAIAERLGTRYFVSYNREHAQPHQFAYRLHKTDGSAWGLGPHAERVRLVVEGPPHGSPLPSAFPSGTMPADTIPYKLYEIVPGALLEVQGPPGTPAEAEVVVRAASGRRFPFRAAGVVDADGVARLRVPYSSGAALPTRAEGPYRVRVGSRERSVSVSAADVTTGAVIGVFQ